MFDVIVVGARCAGASTAMLLARHGYRVLLVDRAVFPSDTMSTHFLPPRGAAMLDRWGLLESLRATGCPPINPITFDVGPAAVTGYPEPVDGVGDSFCPRRTILDKLLVDAAVEAGVELREKTTVDDLIWDEDKVVGVKGHSDRAGSMSEYGRIVVGADGQRSRIAQLVDAPTYSEYPAMTGVLYTYWAGFEADHTEFHIRNGRYVYVFPTHDNLTCVYVALHADGFDAFRSDIETNYLQTLRVAPTVAARASDAERVAPFRGTNRLPNFYRKPYGLGWALVGDAGHHKDPVTGMGMSDAFRDAQLLADAIHEGLWGQRSPIEALADYEATRNQASKHIYEFTLAAAALRDQIPMVPFLQAIQNDHTEVSRFISVLTGTIPTGDVLGPENMQRALARTT